MTTLHTAAIVGIDAVPVTVEAAIARGLPNFVIVGLPDASVQESRERIRTALRHCDLPFPRTRITVNLAPADIRKEGPSYDLPIAVAVLEAGEAVPPSPKRRMFVGELALDGGVRPVSGALSVALAAAACGTEELYVPEANAREASLAAGVLIFPVRTLPQLIAHLEGRTPITPEAASDPVAATAQSADFADIRGQHRAKRALEIAAAGGHNVLLAGPPGSGKTALARALPGIMPPMTRGETIETMQIAGVAGLPADGARPFRSPHHSSSGIALIGGGAWPRPGEITLAHRGVLFLDEFPEFRRTALEHLRQPLEDGFVTLARAGGSLRFPAKCMLVAAQNPCPCGYSGDTERRCSCTPAAAARYRQRVSGPLLDRIDLHVGVPRVDIAGLMREGGSEEPSAAIRERVTAARRRQTERLSPHGLVTNAEMGGALAKRLCRLDDAARSLLVGAAARLHLTARSAVRVMKIARTIADLDEARDIESRHVAEALQYRDSA